jgi:CheY-like chemotaxis protein
MSPSPPTAARILVVDDDDANREVLGIILGHEGFMTVAAGSGEEALAILAQQPLDLVLLDVILPGISGYEAAAAMTSNPATKHIPIIMMTAMNDAASRARAVRSGAADFLSKPFDRNELCSRVRKLLLTPVAA